MPSGAAASSTLRLAGTGTADWCHPRQNSVYRARQVLKRCGGRERLARAGDFPRIRRREAVPRPPRRARRAGYVPPATTDSGRFVGSGTSRKARLRRLWNRILAGKWDNGGLPWAVWRSGGQLPDLSVLLGDFAVVSDLLEPLSLESPEDSLLLLSAAFFSASAPFL